MDCIEERFIFRREKRERGVKREQQGKFRIYRKQKGRQSMMSTRDDEPF